MFPGLQESQLAGAIQAMLFVSDEPVSTITLAGMLQVDAASVQHACVELGESLVALGSGIQLNEVAGGWQLGTKPEYHELLEQYVLSWDTRKLSQAMLEVLAVVAYVQPVTRQGIASVRGVNSDSSLNSLVDKGLVRESGFADTPGNPSLYVTTRSFLEKFGLRSLDDLPALEQFAPDAQTKAYIVSRLSSARSSASQVSDLDARLIAGAESRGIAGAEGQGIDSAEGRDAAQNLEAAMQGMIADALASSAGVVTKIDFDDLQFEE